MNRRLYKKYIRLFWVSLFFSFFFVQFLYAQDIKEEKQEEQLNKVVEELKQLEREQAKQALRARWTSHIRTAFGYETNPKLSTIRKGDSFEFLRYTLDVRKTFIERNQLGVSLDISQQNYNEVTDLTNTLGHTRVDYKLALNQNYILGSGFDMSFSNFPYSRETTYYYPKLFVNLQHRVTKSFYHQLQYEYGWKMFSHAKALLSSTSTYQDNDRKDVREAVEYSLGYTWNERLSSNLRITNAFNNSNSFFQDYYDYHSFQISPKVFYKINDQLSSSLSYSYEYKPYSSRNVTGGAYEQLDRISNLKLGFQYALTKQSTLAVDYTYAQNASNDSQSDYTGNAFEGSWRYIF